MRENKQEGGKIEKKKGKEINKGKRITESQRGSRAIRAIYIEPLTSKPLLEFHESSDSYGENIDVGQEILKALKHFATIQRT